MESISLKNADNTIDSTYRAYFDYILKGLEGKKFDSILEMGAQHAYVLRAIQRKYPNVRLEGFDNKQENVVEGYKVIQHDATQTPWPYPDKSFDIVMSVATFILIPYEYTDKIIEEMKRIARKGILFMEHHIPKEGLTNEERIENQQHAGSPYYIRDYKQLLEKHGFNNIKLVKNKKDINGYNWSNIGYVITADI